MTIYAIPESVPAECTYLTAGKRYEVLRDDYDMEYLIADNGDEINVKWGGTAHLNGANWTRVVEGEGSQDKGAGIEQAITFLRQFTPLSVSSLWDAEQERQIAIAMVGFASRTPTEPLECAPGYHRRPPDREESVADLLDHFAAREHSKVANDLDALRARLGREGTSMEEWNALIEASSFSRMEASRRERHRPHPAPSSGGKGDAALREALEEAKLQLEYLDKRHPTGTTPAVIDRIDAALSEAQAGGGE